MWQDDMMEWKKGQYHITDDQTQFDMGFVVEIIQNTSWRKGVSGDKIKKGFSN